MRPVRLFLLLLLATTSAGADMFKWTDADGNTQYGQYPPAGVQAERMKSAPAPAAPAQRKSPQEQVKEMEQERGAREKAKTEAAQKKQQAANREINCQRARDNLGRLDYSANRLMKMPDGSYQRLDEKTRQAEIRKNREAVEKFCGQE